MVDTTLSRHLSSFRTKLAILAHSRFAIIKGYDELRPPCKHIIGRLVKRVLQLSQITAIAMKNTTMNEFCLLAKTEKKTESFAALGKGVWYTW